MLHIKGLNLVQIHQTLSITTSVFVVVFSEIITNLTTCERGFAESAIFSESRIRVYSDCAPVQHGVVQIVHSLDGILVFVIIHKAETTWNFCNAVETHDNTLHEPHAGEVLVDLRLRGEEGEVTNVNCRRFAKCINLGLPFFGCLELSSDHEVA